MNRTVAILGAQEPLARRLAGNNSNVFRGIPPYMLPYGRDLLAASPVVSSFYAYGVALLTALIEDVADRVVAVNDFFNPGEAEALTNVFTADPAVIGISTTYLTSAESIAEIISACRARAPRARVVLGGAGIINYPEQRAAADLCVWYHGEQCWPAVAAALLNGRDPAGTPGTSVVRDGKESVAPHTVEADLGRLPHPCWEAVIHGVRQQSFLPVEYSRGCVGKCVFCFERRYYPRVIHRPVEAVMAELETNRERFGVSNYFFVDSNLVNERARLRALLAALRSRGGFTWTCQTRLDTLDEGLVEEMAAAGCVGIAIGVETGSPRLLAAMGKAMSGAALARGATVIQRMAARGMIANLNLIVGFPGEDEGTVAETIDYVVTSGAQTYTLSKYFLERGTEVWTRRDVLGLRGEGYRWRGPRWSFAQLDTLVRDIYLALSARSAACHWPAACTEVHKYLAAGKSTVDFLNYLRHVQTICHEDLTRAPGTPVSEGYHEAFRALIRSA